MNSDKTRKIKGGSGSDRQDPQKQLKRGKGGLLARPRERYRAHRSSRN